MSFYAGQRVVVTGGAGMVGSALVTLLRDQGANVLVLDDLSRGSTKIDHVYYMRGDAGDLNTCKAVFRLDGPVFAVFNLAAYVAGVQFNQSNQALMFERNVRLQTVPIQAAALAGVPHVLQTSSVCVYSPEHNHPAREADGHAGEPHQANNGYAWAKRMGERSVQWAELDHAVIVRPSNIYGPRDYFDDRAHVIPALIKKAITDDVIRVNGSGYEQREFIYVDDVAKGILHALEHGAHHAAYNVGTNGETCISIRELVGLIQIATDTEDKEVVFTQDFDSGDPARRSDCTAIKDLGWYPEIPLLRGLQDVVEWYQGAKQ